MLAKKLAAAAAKDSDKRYVKDVFSTYLYDGNGTTQTINNGIDLATEGGLVWLKRRDSAVAHGLFDTVRGVTKRLASSGNAAEQTLANSLTSFNADGFSLGAASPQVFNRSDATYASWTFRRAPKFFDVVTYTGDGTSNRQIAHALGAEPGFITTKSTSAAGDWNSYHRSATGDLVLNSTAAQTGSRAIITAADSSTFTVSGAANTNGVQYVAYLWAHDPSFNGLIKCGGYTGTDNYQEIDLGWEAQFVIVRRTNSTGGSWLMADIMRGMPVSGAFASLDAETTNAEGTYAASILPVAKGFALTGSQATANASGSTYIYVAIRRGPMRTPESGAEVFSPTVYTGTNTNNRLVNTGMLTDMCMVRQRNHSSVAGFVVGDRLHGDEYLLTADTAAGAVDADSFMTPTAGYGNSFSAMNGFGVGNNLLLSLNVDTAANNHVALAFRRALGVFDAVGDTGTGVVRTVPHNLKATPELIIRKRCDASGSWSVYAAPLGATKGLQLESSSAEATAIGLWNDTAPTYSQFTVGTGVTNVSGSIYVSYLFATLPGISKVGSYTGTGTTQQIDCGFAAGTRFVLIKRTDSTGDWYVWDSARGIVAGNDPYLLLNSSAAEVTSTDYIDTYSAGFEISATAPAAINASGGDFIFLAIA